MGVNLGHSTSQHFVMADAQKLIELGLKKKDIDAVNFAFDVYDFKGNGTIDAFYVGDVLRACNLNPTLKCIEELGGKEAPKGGFHDYVEILKLYDKNGDDTMQGNDLWKLLCNLGEKLTKKEAKMLMNDLCEPEDEDGFMQFKPFLERMCAPEK